MRKLAFVGLLSLSVLSCSTNSKVESILKEEFAKNLSEFEKLEDLKVLKADKINLKQYGKFKMVAMQDHLTFLKKMHDFDSSSYDFIISSIEHNNTMIGLLANYRSHEIPEYHERNKEDSLKLEKQRAKMFSSDSTVKAYTVEIEKMKNQFNSKDSLNDYGYVARVYFKVISSTSSPTSDTASLLISKDKKIDRIDEEFLKLLRE